MSFGQWLRQKRKQEGLKQEALAAKVGKDQSWVSRIETGRESLTLSEVKMLGEALGDIEGAIAAIDTPRLQEPYPCGIEDRDFVAAYLSAPAEDREIAKQILVRAAARGGGRVG